MPYDNCTISCTTKQAKSIRWINVVWCQTIHDNNNKKSRFREKEKERHGIEEIASNLFKFVGAQRMRLEQPTHKFFYTSLEMSIYFICRQICRQFS